MTRWLQASMVTLADQSCSEGSVLALSLLYRLYRLMDVSMVTSTPSTAARTHRKGICRPRQLSWTCQTHQPTHLAPIEKDVSYMCTNKRIDPCRCPAHVTHLLWHQDLTRPNQSPDETCLHTYPTRLVSGSKTEDAREPARPPMR
jgi:hypothetical protein